MSLSYFSFLFQPPFHDRVVVRRIDASAKTKGGIIIPDTAKERPQEGEVIAVGPGGRDDNRKLVPLDVKAGNRPVAISSHGLWHPVRP